MSQCFSDEPTLKFPLGILVADAFLEHFCDQLVEFLTHVSGSSLGQLS